jgi:hypothetical protein
MRGLVATVAPSVSQAKLTTTGAPPMIDWNRR